MKNHLSTRTAELFGILFLLFKQTADFMLIFIMIGLSFQNNWKWFVFIEFKCRLLGTSIHHIVLLFNLNNPFLQKKSCAYKFWGLLEQQNRSLTHHLNVSRFVAHKHHKISGWILFKQWQMKKKKKNRNKSLCLLFLCLFHNCKLRIIVHVLVCTCIIISWNYVWKYARPN